MSDPATFWIWIIIAFFAAMIGATVADVIRLALGVARHRSRRGPDWTDPGPADADAVVLTMPCRDCGAVPGQRCMRELLPGPPHASRIRAWRAAGQPDGRDERKGRRP